MNYRRHGLKALGLSFLAMMLGLMAFSAAGAQGALINEGEWLIGTKTFKELFAKGESETILAVNEGIGTLLILKLNLILECLKAHAEGSILELGHGKVTILFQLCKVLTHAGAEAACTVPDIKANVLAQVILHGPDGKELPYILFSPLDGLTFALVNPTGEFCTLPHAEVKGNTVAHLTWPLEDKIEHLILVNKETLELFPEDILKYGAHVAHLEAAAWVKLTGKYKEKHVWGAR